MRKEGEIMISWDQITHADVVRTLREYDRLGSDEFLAKYGFGRTLKYDLIWEMRSYPPKAILGAAYEAATGRRLRSTDFEGGKSGAVSVLTVLGFIVREK
jgi:hypothetical protein